CSLFSSWVLRASTRIEGTAGLVKVLNPFAPQFFHRLSVLTPAGTRSERVTGGATYDYQLPAFVAAVRDGAPVPTGPLDAIANMRAIERIYASAGRPAPPAAAPGR